jgi:hypothetical protein
MMMMVMRWALGLLDTHEVCCECWFLDLHYVNLRQSAFVKRRWEGCQYWKSWLFMRYTAMAVETMI